MSVLELFAAQKRPLSSTDIASLLNIAASSCHDVVHLLETRGYLCRSGHPVGWYPTLRLFEVAATIAAHDPVVPALLAPLSTLRDVIDESVLLSKVDGLQAIYLRALQPSHPLRYLATAGDRVRSLHAASAGKALLGSLSDAALTRFLASAELTRYTPQTIVSTAALRTDLMTGNDRGWFLNAEESAPGLTTLSCRFNWGLACYIVTVAGPTARLQPKLAEACHLLMQLCRQLGELTSFKRTR